MITPREVGLMSDEEIAERLNEHWTMLLCLLLEQGGKTHINRETIENVILDDYEVIHWQDYPTWRLMLRAEKKNAKG